MTHSQFFKVRKVFLILDSIYIGCLPILFVFFIEIHATVMWRRIKNTAVTTLINFEGFEGETRQVTSLQREENAN